MAQAQRNRFFQTGEKVVVKKKTHLVDIKRENEGIPKGVKAQPIDENVTGIEGQIEGAAYQSPTKSNRWMVPIRVGNGGVISVPEERLERESRTPTTERSEPAGPSSAHMSKETIAFWRDYFRKEDELKELRKNKRRG